MKVRRVLITGGAGFLGTHLARRFRADGVDVRVLDVADGEAMPDGEVDRRRGDVRDPTAIGQAIEGVDAVIHAAFASPHQPADVIRAVNVDGTRNVCEAALARGVSRVILVSSTIVSHPRRRHPLFPEGPASRFEAYRLSRASAEALVSEYAARGLSTAIVRPKTFVGPERVGAFAIVFEWVRLGNPVVVFGRGENRYQLLDPRDMADAMVRLATADVRGLFFFGAREFQRVRDDFQALLDHAGSGSGIRFVPSPLARAALRGLELANLVPASEWHYMTAFGRDSVVDISRAERELDWHPASSNARALIDAYDWYVSTVRQRGQAPTTHPIPRSHQLLGKLVWFLPG